MSCVPIHVLKQACQIFIDLAYPDGLDTVPEARRAYGEIPGDADAGDYLPPSDHARGLVNILAGTHPGFSFRLGCSTFPYLRLTLQRVSEFDETSWLCGVDTHDSWHHPEHPDAAAWLSMQAANRELKSRIETAWEAAGLLTHNRLLRQELHSSKR